MAGEDAIARLLRERRSRLIAGIMGAAESSTWWRKLTVGEQKEFRDKVITDIGVFYDLCRDMVKVSGEDPRNEYVIQVLQQVHDTARRIEKQVGSG